MNGKILYDRKLKEAQNNFKVSMARLSTLVKQIEKGTQVKESPGFSLEKHLKDIKEKGKPESKVEKQAPFSHTGAAIGALLFKPDSFDLTLANARSKAKAKNGGLN